MTCPLVKNYPVFQYTIAHSAKGILIGIFSMIISCTNSTFYEEHKIVSSDLIWPMKKAVSFDLNLQNLPQKQDHEISIHLRHHYYIDHNNIPLRIKIINKNKIQTKTYIINIPLRDEENQILGSAMGDIVDIVFTPRGKKAIEIYPGNYFIEITPATNKPVLNIMEVGLSIKAIN